MYSPSAVDGLDATIAAANDRHSTACNMIHVRAHTVRHRAATPPTVVKNENDITTATIVSRRIGMFTRRKEITKKKKKKKTLSLSVTKSSPFAFVRAASLFGPVYVHTLAGIRLHDDNNVLPRTGLNA